MLAVHFIQETNLLEFLYLTLKLITFFFFFFSNGCFLSDKTRLSPLRLFWFSLLRKASKQNVSERLAYFGI